MVASMSRKIIDMKRPLEDIAEAKGLVMNHFTNKLS